MKGKLINVLGVLGLISIVAPAYAHARGGYGDFIGSSLITLLVISVVFLILREVVCWYWKINETLSVLKEIRDLLKGGSSAEKITSPSTSSANSGGTSNSPVANVSEVTNLEVLEKIKTLENGNCHECGVKTNKKLKRCMECHADFTEFKTS